jgi:ATP-dependent DNA helicase RecQ
MTNQSEKQHAIKCLTDMVNYATVHACRRKQLLNYFGEAWPPAKTTPNVPHPTSHVPLSTPHVPLSTPHVPHSPQGDGGCCDICSGQMESIDATRDAQIVMSAIARTGERYGASHIAAVVVGENSDRIKDLGHHKIKTFGVGKDRDRHHWRMIIDSLLTQSLLQQTEGGLPVLRLRPESNDVLFGQRKVSILKGKKLPPESAKGGAAQSPDDDEENLSEQLRALRKELAEEQGVPPYVIFSDRSLNEMVSKLPANESEMLQITGVGERRFADYGQQFLDAIQPFR